MSLFKLTRRKVFRIFLLIIFVGLFLLSLFFNFTLQNKLNLQEQQVPQLKNKAESSFFPEERTIAKLASSLKPGVVFVSAWPSIEMIQEGPPPDIEGSEGAGFIISKDGLILTNYHVVEGNAKNYIKTLDGQVYEATVVAQTKYYPDEDLALLRAPIPNPIVLKFGETEKVAQGERIFNIGHPNIFGNWVTTAGEFIGMAEFISSPDNVLRRDIKVIKPGSVGNSGSPLFNLEGEVVGIIYGNTPGSEWIKPEEEVVIWKGNAGSRWGSVELAHNTLTIFNFLKEAIGEARTQEIFKRGEGLLIQNSGEKAIAKVSQLSEVKEFKILVEENGRSSFTVEIAGLPEKDFPYYLVQVFEIFPDHRTTFGWYRFDPKTEVLWRQKLDGDWEEIL